MPKTLVNSGETFTNAINVKKEWSVRKDSILEDLLELCKGEAAKISWCKQGKFCLLSKRA
jgi:hypothetical protein